MAGVINPGRRADGGLLSTVMKGLSIARDVYGIKTDMAQLEKMEAQEKERIEAAGKLKKRESFTAGGGMSRGDLNKEIMAGKVKEVPEGTAGAIPVQLDPDNPGLVTYVARVEAEKSPMLKSVGNQLVQVGSDGTSKVVHTAPQTPKAPKEPGTRLITTTDANGNPVQRIVQDTPGTEFPGAPPTEKAPNSDKFKVATFARRLEQAESVFGDLSANNYNRASWSSAVGAGMPEGLKSNEAKKQAQAERNFINAVLRRESGASISPAEFENAEQQYFPRAGDSAEVIEQKRLNRQLAFEGLAAEAGEDVLSKVPSLLVPGSNRGGPSEAIAAPAQKAPEEMTAAERAAELQRLRGK